MFSDFQNENNPNDDFLDEFRQKLSSQPLENLEEKKNEINRSKNVFIGTVSGIALAAVVGWFVLSPRYAGEDTAEIPVIRRPQTAIKVQPSEPGGMEILNQDKSVYDIIEKKDNSAPVVENPLPPPEEPKPQAIVQAPVVAVEPLPVEQKAEEILKTAEIKKAPEPQAVKNEQPPAPEVPLSQIAAAQPTPAASEVKEPAPAPEPAKVAVPAKEEVKAADAAPAVSAAQTTGPWTVQLISSPNRKSVDSAWNGLEKKYASLSGQPHEVEAADLGAKGTFYRLFAGAFADRAGADKLCNDIKALGGTCLVKKK